MAIDPMADPAPRPRRSQWVQALRMIAFVLAYLLPLFWLWHRTGWPERFGVTVDHGRIGLYENWYYSYHLLQGQSVLDLVTFLYMWAPVVGYLAWLALRTHRNVQARRGGTPRDGMPR